MDNKVRLGKLEINLGELAEFLVEAKKNCYAGEGKEKILSDGSKELTFQQGNFHYTDNYDGWYQAPGFEIVRWKNKEGKRIWSMAYSGGMSNPLSQKLNFTKQTFVFLKKALMHIDVKKPFRGPENSRFWGENKPENYGKFLDKEFSYSVETRGNIERFYGEEFITLREGSPQPFIVFSQDYIGGLYIPKK